VSGPHPDDLPGTGSKTGACGMSGITESSDLATAARQIAGKRAPTASGQNQKPRTLLNPESGRRERTLCLAQPCFCLEGVGARLPAICREPAARPVYAVCQA